ncbi:hypothetical protein AVEN_229015-1 [Araneus ventricosus]|uniref:Uncharacterized protein n=1 Tax=Araneus ventricosus TaxID=182803 RepID=A0A4Y2KLJ0_ARAVE|nr:hypothetical protein AVEN_229015-1 [Araneus ventricosus]
MLYDHTRGTTMVVLFVFKYVGEIAVSRWWVRIIADEAFALSAGMIDSVHSTKNRPMKDRINGDRHYRPVVWSIISRLRLAGVRARWWST